MIKFKVKNIKLARQGQLKVAWATKEMPVLEKITGDFKKNQSFKGIIIAACLHITKETAVLAKALVAGGAKVALCGSNPLSTQDDIAAAIAKDGINIFAWRGLSSEKYYWCLNKVLDLKPQITIDDGADLISTIHKSRKSLIKSVYGGQEETTTGVIRLRAMEKAGKLKYPVVAINDAKTKHLFDNYYGTGQSTIDGLLRATNILLSGKKIVVCGYGQCGKGIAEKARGMGAHVIVVEVNPFKALQASMDGFYVTDIKTASRIGEVFITATGNKDVITHEHIKLMKDGAILGNSGHFNVEINTKDIQHILHSIKQIRDNLTEYTLKSGKRLYLIADGRLMNLAAAEGHPSSVMDMSFANQALVCEWLVKSHQLLENKVYDVPEQIDEKVARMKLQAMGIKIDQLTPAQKKYLNSWQEGT